MQGSSIGAEQRIQEIEIRCERALGPLGEPDAHQNLSTNLHKHFKEPDFKAIAAVMQNQMYSAAFDSGKETDKQSNGFDMTMMQSMMPNPMAAESEFSPEMQMLMQGFDGKLGLDTSSYSNEEVLPIQRHKTMAPQHHHHHEHAPVSPKTSMVSELLPGAYSSKVTEADLPVDGRISSHYGDRSHPVNGHHHFHTGVDIAAPLGSPIKAPWDGKVVYVGNVSGFGPNTVIMEHPATTQADGKVVYSVFGHNHSVDVRKGDVISKGDAFATVGSEGRSTGPHLHWETRLAEPGLAGKDIFKHEISMTVNPLKFV